MSKVVFQADALTDEEIAQLLVGELENAPPVHLHLTAQQTLWIVGILQLASRYPGFEREHPDWMVMIRQFADQLKQIGPVTAMAIEWGFAGGRRRVQNPPSST